MGKIGESIEYYLTMILFSPLLIIFVPLILMIAWSMGEYRNYESTDNEVECAKKQYEEERKKAKSEEEKQND